MSVVSKLVGHSGTATIEPRVLNLLRIFLLHGHGVSHLKDAPQWPHVPAPLHGAVHSTQPHRGNSSVGRSMGCLRLGAMYEIYGIFS